ncbi:MAG TPA: hypothetical protein VMW24_23345 [Sedimentisphaerales bacterium]|nr:hypothetical protein [Sedimentisphaerales bacterium]
MAKGKLKAMAPTCETDQDARGIWITRIFAPHRDGCGRLELFSDDNRTLAFCEDDGSHSESTEEDLANAFTAISLREIAALAAENGA